MKKIIAFVTTLFILIFTTIPAFAADGLPYVVDNADLLSASEEIELEANLSKFSEDNNFDIVVLTVDSLDGKTPMAYADDYYDYTGYGYGENHDGCLLLISMEDRDWYISTTGYGITALTDAGIDYISDHFLDDLSSGDYYNAFLMYAYLVSDFVQQANIGTPYDYNNLDEYDEYYDDIYYDDYEDEESGLLNYVVAGVIGGVIFTLVIMSILKAK